MELCPVQNSLYIQVLRSAALAALVHGTPAAGISQTLRHGTTNGNTELSQMAPRMFGRAAITLSIGPHSRLRRPQICVDLGHPRGHVGDTMLFSKFLQRAAMLALQALY